ncbi:MAG TPA: HNH endonuclease [Reyranella sp.]
MKAIFDTRAESGYDDDIVRRYHFPNRYLAAAQQAVGDWIIYREPRRAGGRSGYVAVARLQQIDPDPDMPDHSYARVADFLPFDAVVPLRHGSGFYERQLSFVAKPSLIGASLQGKSVRLISDEEFAEITLDGLNRTLAPDNAVRLELDADHVDRETLELISAPEQERQRRIVQMLVNRKIREASFRKNVVDAYDNTCAVTRLKIVNGGGKAEAQAAHIWSVGSGGPDVVRNGIALSATVHWLFDRHLISLTDEYGLLVSHNRVPAELRPLFQNQLQRIHLPKDRTQWPHLAYVRRHRAAYVG